MNKTPSILMLSVAVASVPALAASPRNQLNFQGYTGLINVPNAATIGPGVGVISRDNQIEGRFTPRNKIGEGNDVFIGASPFAGVEMVGRNITADSSGGSDLSFNIKIASPWSPIEGFRFAFGESDLGGSVNEFDGRYLVGSYTYDAFRITLGAGEASVNSNVARAFDENVRLDGVFGGIEYQPFSWLGLLAEHDADDVNYGLRLNTPDHWFGGGLNFSATYAELGHESERPDDSFFSIAVNMDLSTGFSGLPPLADRLIEEPVNPKPQVIVEDLDNLLVSEQDQASFTALAVTLVSHGFEEVNIWQERGTVYVVFENHVFNQNLIDALGLAMGEAATHLPASATFHVQMQKYGVPLFSAQGRVSDYRAFLAGEQSSPMLTYRTAPSSVVRRGAGTWAQLSDFRYFKPTVMVKPLLSSTLGTEYGVFDYSLAARADVRIPVWRGAVLNINYDVPVDDSKDFKTGGIFAGSKIRSGVKDVVFNQTVPLWQGATTMLSAGRFFDKQRGVLSESRWEPGNGNHRLRLLYGRFKDQDTDIQRTMRLASYSYFAESLNTSFTVMNGTFYSQDKGTLFDVTRHVGDTQLHLRYKQVKFAGRTVKLGAIGFTVPLT
ncbi:YjbH domain-containing protein, partial [Litorivivens sp.]|uniref:YjbH domain-containing protein n=1 Tax=Litorivivens sp. TaxID=2020868 RepID=UPI003562CBF6